MNIPPLQPSIDLSEVSLEQLAGKEGISEEEKVGEIARQFEAVLLRQILKDVQKPIIKSEFTGDSTSREIYQDLFTSNLAESISRAGGLGVAESIKTQLARQVHTAIEKSHQP